MSDKITIELIVEGASVFTLENASFDPFQIGRPVSMDISKFRSPNISVFSERAIEKANEMHNKYHLKYLVPKTKDVFCKTDGMVSNKVVIEYECMVVDEVTDKVTLY